VRGFFYGVEKEALVVETLKMRGPSLSSLTAPEHKMGY